MPERLDGYFATGKENLYWRGWVPKSPVGVVLICHGANEHVGRYEDLAEFLAQEGWAVYGFDLRGHGRSTGLRVHIKRFEDWLDDFDSFRNAMLARHESVPVIAFGHSVGGQIVLGYALEAPQRLNGIVLSSPLLTSHTVSPGKVTLASFAARVAPRARVKLVDLNLISQDRAVVNRYKRDPHVCHEYATLGFAKVVSSQFDVLIERARNLKIPVLIQHGSDDAIASPEGSYRLATRVPKQYLRFRTYLNFWHEIYNEPERHKPLHDLAEWLRERLPR